MELSGAFITPRAYTLAFLYLMSIPVYMHAFYTAVSNASTAGTQTFSRSLSSVRTIFAIRPIAQQIGRRYMLMLLRKF